MIRKSTGTPFKLKGAPFKEDGKPDGSTTKSENLGEYATDENHLVNVTRNTTTTPNYDGGPAPEAKRGGRRYKGKDFIGDVLMKSDRFKGLSGQAMADAGHISKSKIGDWDERTGYKPSEGKKEVKYETKEIPNPGKPGGTMDSFTSAEGRDLSRLARNTANAAVRDSRKLKKAEDGTLFGRLFTKKGREQGRKAKKEHQARKIAIRRAEAEAGAKQSENAGIQQSTGTNTWTTTDKMQNGEGTPGTSFTIAPDNTRKLSDLINGNNSNNSGNSFAELGSRIEDLKKFKLETPTVESLSKKASGSDTVEINGFGGPVTIDKSTLKYGRNKTATPFKLKKYKK
jgi:hypothetical protein